MASTLVIPGASAACSGPVDLSARALAPASGSGDGSPSATGTSSAGPGGGGGCCGGKAGSPCAPGRFCAFDAPGSCCDGPHGSITVHVNPSFPAAAPFVPANEPLDADMLAVSRACAP